MLRRRSWFAPSSEPLFPNSEQVQIIWTQWKKQKIVECLKPHQIYNRIEGNHLLTNKYYLLSTMRDYYDRAGLGKCHLDVMPLTYRLSIDIAVQPNVNMNSGFQSFRDAFEQSRALTGQSIWIVKPGENSNRGRGIEIFKDLEAIKVFVETCAKENEPEKTKFVI